MKKETSDRLAFFGRMNAHISHELKNICATISETSGLLTDLMEMHGVDKAPHGERLFGLCDRIAGLVDRGNETVRNMNRFAHSIDQPVAHADLNDLLSLLTSLAAYMPYAREIRLELPEEDARLSTRPFLLLNLLYGCIAGIFPTLDMGQSMTLSLAPKGDGAAITLSPAPKALPDDADELAKALNATVENNGKTVTVKLAPVEK